MGTEYLLEKTGMAKHEGSEAVPPGTPCIQVYTHEEFDRDILPNLGRPIVSQTMHRALACHADLFDTCTVGVLAIPDKEHLMSPMRVLKFYIDSVRLIIVDDTSQTSELLASLSHTHRNTALTLARMLFFIMESLIVDDAAFLEEYEAQLESAEEDVIQMAAAEANRTITKIRRELLRLDYYYEQMEDIGELLEDNANDLFERSDSNLFGIFSRHADRLFDRTRTLKEYSLQLYQLQQTELDTKLNETMRWLTVVQSIFVPLTLVTSWYGMNFETMPELAWRFGYMGVIVVCIAIAVFELIFLKRRKWL